MSEFTLHDLAAVIHARRGAQASASYTKSLLEAGVAACAKKLGEEAAETVIAAMQGDRRALRAEAADLIYHLLVLLEASDVSFDEVLAELDARTGRSGHEEKASRRQS
ncbi:MAG: phosphoribosyl-ATP diphosphatase [Hyphomicrobiales bacterium]|nr:phosphoribosyl-ATP diphosphatase [Hyphomicrobiales bacterium]